MSKISRNRFFLERTLSFFLVFVFCFLFQSGFSKDRDLGFSAVHKTTPCFFEGAYTTGKDYDIDTSLQNVKLEMEKPFVLKVSVLPLHLKEGTYISFTFFDPSDKEHQPIADLSHTGTSEEVAGASFVQLRAYKKLSGKMAIAPVIYKKGLRGKIAGQPQSRFFIPFFPEGDDVLTDVEGQSIGGHGNLFTTLFITVAGKGTYKAKDFDRMVLPNSDGYYVFFIHLNPVVNPQMFFITAITKAAILPSERGLRSPIVSSVLNISKSCKK